MTCFKTAIIAVIIMVGISESMADPMPIKICTMAYITERGIDGEMRHCNGRGQCCDESSKDPNCCSTDICLNGYCVEDEV